MKKRLLAMLMALVMCLSLIPTAAFAIELNNGAFTLPENTYTLEDVDSSTNGKTTAHYAWVSDDSNTMYIVFGINGKPLNQGNNYASIKFSGADEIQSSNVSNLFDTLKHPDGSTIASVSGYQWEIASFDITDVDFNIAVKIEVFLSTEQQGNEGADNQGHEIKNARFEIDGTLLPSVSYIYDGEVPEGAPELPETVFPEAGNTVNVQEAPVLDGYTFSGWTTEDVDLSNDGSFNMPEKNVVFVGSWTKNLAVTITADSDTKVYDGTALTKDSYTNTSLAEGDKIDSVTISGSQTVVGSSDNVPSDAKIVNAEGVDVTENYDITYVNGTLSVTKRNVTLTSASDSKEYDGTPLTNSTVTVGGDGFATGEGATYDVTGTVTDPVSAPNTFTYALKEGTNSDNYTITKTEGTLTVTKIATEIVITAASGNKKYDGQPLTNSGYTYTEGVLAEGDVLTAEVEGTITDVGTADNVVTSYKVMRGETDVTANYTFGESVNGTLAVTKRAVTLTSADDSKVYDGTALTNGNVTVTGDGFVDGEGATYNVSGTQTNVGSSANTFTYTLSEGTKADNYEITKTEGTLEVTKGTAANLSADSYNAPYDGNAHGITVTGTVAGDTVYYSLNGTDWQTTAPNRTNVQNPETVYVKAVNPNYADRTTTATITITPRELTITADSATKAYDSDPLTKNSYQITSGTLANNQNVTSITVTGSQTAVGSSDNVAKDAVIKAGNTDVTANYNITYVKGTLKVTGAILNVTEKTIQGYEKGQMVKAGDLITFTITVKNTGNISGTVVATDITDVIQYKNAEDEWAALEGATVTIPKNFSLAVAEGETNTFEVTWEVPESAAGLTIKNIAGIGNQTNPPETPSVTVENPGLSVTKTITSPAKVDGRVPMVKEGDTITWQIVVTNTGNTNLTNITLSDDLTIGGVSASDVVLKDGAADLTGTFDLTAGESKTITASYVVKTADAGKEIVNKATAETGDTKGESEPTDPITVEKKSLDVTKTADKDKAKVGETITYTITVKNTGNVDLENVVISDTFNGKGTLSFTNTDNVTFAEGKFTVKTLEVDETETIKVKYVVARNDANQTITNAAASDLDSNKGDDSTSTKIDRVKRPSSDTDIDDKVPLETEDHFAYIIGYPDGNVKPAGNITRAEVATIFFRLLTDDARDLFWSTENEYSDVAADQWFNNAISTLSNAGIINGYEDGSFRPNNPITRAEFAKIAASFFTYAEKEYQGLFSDVPAEKWYALFVEAASDLGLVTGYEDGTFRPEQFITRAESCTIVNRTIDRHPHEDQLHEDMVVWPDNPAPGEAGHMWYYEQVQEATNSHDYEMKDNYENWTEILENRDWGALEKEWSDSNSAPGGEVMK